MHVLGKVIGIRENEATGLIPMYNSVVTSHILPLGGEGEMSNVIYDQTNERRTLSRGCSLNIKTKNSLRWPNCFHGTWSLYVCSLLPGVVLQGTQSRVRVNSTLVWSISMILTDQTALTIATTIIKEDKDRMEFLLISLPKLSLYSIFAMYEYAYASRTWRKGEYPL